ncbi:MAG: inositol monophosphatase, partial [Planctomycetales bacterium]|nr:inositol monophosphatase [Planctomycetales bacterium]
LGVVFDPVREQLFWARRGQGAWLNAQRLQTSSIQCMDGALIAASFAARVPPNSPEVTRFVQVLHTCQAIRRLGSAALNLCYVAAGKLDAYWASSVKTWDVAAGLLLVEEAGGRVTDLAGHPVSLDHPILAAASTAELHREFLATLAIEN